MSALHPVCGGSFIVCSKGNMMPAISLGYLGVKYLELGSLELWEPKTGVAIEVVN